MLALGLALLAAASNAVASVLQRLAARKTPPDERFRLSLLVDLARRPMWLGGIGALICGFLLQASALSFGSLALVQPTMASELPLTLLIAARVLGHPLGRRAWLGTASVAVGLGLLLWALSPRSGHAHVTALAWVIGVGAGLVAALALTMAGRTGGPAGAALLGAAAGVSFGLTAALMKGVTTHLSSGVAALFTSGLLYAMVAVGILSLYLLQNALQSGPLAAAQPALTLADPITAIVLGAALFHETLRLDVWLIPELAGLTAILLGSIELSRSKVMVNDEPDR